MATEVVVVVVLTCDLTNNVSPCPLVVHPKKWSAMLPVDMTPQALHLCAGSLKSCHH